MPARSVLGNASAAAAPPADISAGADGQVLQRFAGALGFQQVPLTSAVSGVLPIANGGTSATNATNARTALGVPSFAEAATLWDQDANAAKITNLAAATLPNDAATLAQAQTLWDQDAGGAKITNLAAATLASDAVRLDQVNVEGFVQGIASTTGAGAVTSTGLRALSVARTGPGVYNYTLAAGQTIKAVMATPYGPGAAGGTTLNLQTAPGALTFSVRTFATGNNPTPVDLDHGVVVF
jgi:hypothetical protein